MAPPPYPAHSSSQQPLRTCTTVVDTGTARARLPGCCGCCGLPPLDRPAPPLLVPPLARGTSAAPCPRIAWAEDERAQNIMYGMRTWIGML